MADALVLASTAWAILLLQLLSDRIAVTVIAIFKCSVGDDGAVTEPASKNVSARAGCRMESMHGDILGES